jgi:hypothetical protein
MKWHAPHPANPKLPACGTVGEDGRPTHRVAKTLTVTCARCKKVLAKQLPARSEPPNDVAERLP